MGGDDLLGGAAHPRQVPARAVGGAERPCLPGPPPRRAREIRIVRTEPERTVDWEAAATDGAEVSGRVEIAPSGWGTRVTLSASRIVAPEPPEPEPPEPVPEPESEAIEVISEPVPEPEIDDDVVVVEPESRRGFFARLFRRRKGQSEAEPTA